jgi:hypothetical protein
MTRTSLAISDMGSAMGSLSPVSSAIHSKYSPSFTVININADT